MRSFTAWCRLAIVAAGLQLLVPYVTPANAQVGNVVIGDATVTEGNSGSVTATFTVTRSGGTDAFNVNFATSNGTATAGVDYQANSGTLSFGVGVNTMTIDVTVFGDTAVEPDETFFVTLSGETNGAVVLDNQAQGTITNDDTYPSTTTVTSSLNSSTLGDSVTFTALVAGNGGGVPTGNLDFKDGSTTLATVPLDAVGAGASVATGITHACALTASGGIQCWGSNDSSQLGDGTTTDSSVPVAVASLSSGVRAIAAGNKHTCALTSAGGVKCWGNNASGQLGNGTQVSSATPVDVIGLASGVSTITARYSLTCALTVGGSVKCWGEGATTPAQVSGLGGGITAISAGFAHACALTGAGGVKCWGYNANGQLGDGTFNSSSTTAVDVSGLGSGVVAIAAGGYHSCAVTGAGAVKCWGNAGSGQLGLGFGGNESNTPVDVSGYASGIRAIAAGWIHTCGLSSAGGVSCWGDTGGSDGSEFASGVATTAGGFRYVCALTVTGAVKCWGINDKGQLGDNSLTNRVSSVDVVGFGDGTALVYSKAMLSTAALAVGSHPITAAYGGDVSHQVSTSPVLNQQVNGAPTATALNSSQNPSVFGQSVTFTATVTAGAGTPSGTVTFKDGATTIGSGPLSAGVATFNTSALTVAAHSITAVYGGDSNYASSTSSVVTQTVNKGATAAVVIAGPNPSTFGQSVTFTATVSASAPASGTPTGTVTFKDGGTTVGSGPLSAGVATFNTSALTGGGHTITAVYNGDGNFVPSTSPGASLTVNKANTTTALLVTPGSATYGQSVTMTATVTGAGATGTVTFKDGTATLAAINVSGGTAAFSTSALAAGAHSLTATYNGDTNFNGSVSSAQGATVGGASTTTALLVSPNPSTSGQTVTVTATVTSPGGTPAGNVTFKDAAVTLGSGTLASGVATFTTTSLAPGGHSLTASYDGNSSFTASTSAPTVQTVILSCADNFANATAISSPTGTTFGSTTPATAEAGEPNHADASTPLNSVWCRWTAPASGPVTFDSTGSNFDTTLAVYTGTSVSALTPVAANNNISGGNNQSRVTFTASAGVAYSVALDGAGPATGSYLLNWTQPPAVPLLFASVLPTSRSVNTNSLATAFASIINSGSSAATGCSIAPPAGFPAGFFYQTTNASNVPTGTANTAIGIPAGAVQGFVFGVTPTADMSGAEVALVFDCANTDPVASVPGLNTLSLSASATPSPDLIAIGSTPSNDGIVSPAVGGTGFFAAAAVNIGIAGDITAAVDDNGKNLPLVVTLCRTNPATGVCINPVTPGPLTTSTLATNEISTYTIFVRADGVVPFDPAYNRLFLRFKTPDGVTRGATSVAVRTQ